MSDDLKGLAAYDQARDMFAVDRERPPPPGTEELRRRMRREEPRPYICQHLCSPAQYASLVEAYRAMGLLVEP